MQSNLHEAMIFEELKDLGSAAAVFCKKVEGNFLHYLYPAL
ncbi:hypothetical protein OSCI_3310014 [Kamptonema sp. PCC 6506]|nr:hypothetical protein OSCI_3310014 [Kamptonema sp. PCC 6506]